MTNLIKHGKGSRSYRKTRLDYDYTLMADGKWSIFFNGNDTGRSFPTLLDAAMWCSRTVDQLDADLLLYGQMCVDAKTGERIDPLTVTVKEVAQ